MLANEASAVCGIDLYTGEHANENRVTGQVTFLTACSVVPLKIFLFFFFFLVVAAELFNIIWSNFVCSDICMYDDDVIYLQSTDIWRQELYGIFDKCKE